MRKAINALINRLGLSLERLSPTLELSITYPKGINTMTTLTLKINVTDPGLLPFEISRAIVRNMRNADSDMARLALKLIENRLMAGESPAIASVITPIYGTYKTDGKNHKAGERYMKTLEMMESAYDLDPADLMILINTGETSYQRWIVDRDTERESKAQTKDRTINRQSKHESDDPKIAVSDIPSLVNQVGKTLALRPKSGKSASYESLFDNMTESELIAAYRAFDSVMLVDDTRRMSAYRAALKTKGMSLQDVQDTWAKLDNPPKATRSKATPRKATPTEQPNATPRKATPAIESTDDDDLDMQEYLEFQKFKAMKARANKR